MLKKPLPLQFTAATVKLIIEEVFSKHPCSPVAFFSLQYLPRIFPPLLLISRRLSGNVPETELLKLKLLY